MAEWNVRFTEGGENTNVMWNERKHFKVQHIYKNRARGNVDVEMYI